MEHDRGGVRGEILVGRPRFDGEGGVVRNGGRRAQVDELRDGVTGFEIRLTVEVLGLDVANVLLLRRRANDNVCPCQQMRRRCNERRTGWDTLVTTQADKVADFEIFPALLDPRRLVERLRAVGKMGHGDDGVGSLLAGLLERAGIALVGIVVPLHLLSRGQSRNIGELIRDRSLACPLALQSRTTDSALPPETLLPLHVGVTIELRLVRLASKATVEEEVGEEGGYTKGARFGMTEIWVVEGSAQRENLSRVSRHSMVACVAP